MPYLMGAPFPAANRAMWDFDFTTLSLGGHAAATFLTETAVNNPGGLTFARMNGTTVQDSASSIISGIGANAATIGNLGSTLANRGLVIQPKTRNGFAGSDGSGNDANRNLSNAAWTAGSLSTRTAATGVDGTSGASAMTIGSGGFSPYGNTGGGNTTVSFWELGTSKQFVRATAINTPGVLTNGSGGGAWERLALSQVTADALSLSCDCRNWVAVGGTSPTARSPTIDYGQYEFGLYTTEATPLANYNRDCDRISYANGAQLVARNGQIKFYAKFIPKFASTNAVYWDVGTSGSGVATGWFLWSFGGVGNYARIRQSDRKLCLKLASGTEVVSTNAVSWAKNDVVEIYVAVGNNIASVAKYRVNAGAWTDLVLATMSAAPAPGANPLAILHNIDASTAGTTAGNVNDIGQMLCWLNRLTFYDARAPAGV